MDLFACMSLKDQMCVLTFSKREGKKKTNKIKKGGLCYGVGSID